MKKKEKETILPVIETAFFYVNFAFPLTFV